MLSNETHEIVQMPQHDMGEQPTALVFAVDAGATSIVVDRGFEPLPAVMSARDIAFFNPPRRKKYISFKSLSL